MAIVEVDRDVKMRRRQRVSQIVAICQTVKLSKEGLHVELMKINYRPWEGAYAFTKQEMKIMEDACTG